MAADCGFVFNKGDRFSVIVENSATNAVLVYADQHTRKYRGVLIDITNGPNPVQIFQTSKTCSAPVDNAVILPPPADLAVSQSVGPAGVTQRQSYQPAKGEEKLPVTYLATPQQRRNNSKDRFARNRTLRPRQTFCVNCQRLCLGSEENPKTGKTADKSLEVDKSTTSSAVESRTRNAVLTNAEVSSHPPVASTRGRRRKGKAAARASLRGKDSVAGSSFRAGRNSPVIKISYNSPQGPNVVQISPKFLGPPASEETASDSQQPHASPLTADLVKPTSRHHRHKSKTGRKKRHKRRYEEHQVGLQEMGEANRENTSFSSGVHKKEAGDGHGRTDYYGDLRQERSLSPLNSSADLLLAPVNKKVCRPSDAYEFEDEDGLNGGLNSNTVSLKKFKSKHNKSGLKPKPGLSSIREPRGGPLSHDLMSVETSQSPSGHSSNGYDYDLPPHGDNHAEDTDCYSQRDDQGGDSQTDDHGGDSQVDSGDDGAANIPQIITRNVQRYTSEEDLRVVKVGGVVWGKIAGFPWWPGLVKSITTSEDASSNHVFAHIAHVSWFGSKTSSTVSCSGLYPFLEHYEDKFVRRRRRGPYQAAVREAKGMALRARRSVNTRPRLLRSESNAASHTSASE